MSEFEGGSPQYPGHRKLLQMNQTLQLQII